MIKKLVNIKIIIIIKSSFYIYNINFYYMNKYYIINIFF